MPSLLTSQFTDPRDRVAELLQCNALPPSDVWPVGGERLTAASEAPWALIDQLSGLTLDDAMERTFELLESGLAFRARLPELCVPLTAWVMQASASDDAERLRNGCALLEACGLIAGHPKTVATARLGLTRCSAGRGELAQAVAWGESAAAVLDFAGDDALAVTVWKDLALLYGRGGRGPEALSTLRRCLRVAKARGSRAHVMDLTIAVAQLARALGSTEIAEALEEELRSTVEEVEREEASGTDPGLRKVVEVLRDIDGCEGGEALREVVERHKSDLDPPLAARVVDAAFHVGTPSLEKVQQFAELIAEVLADRSGLVAFRLGLGRTMRANGNPELALACYTGAAEEASEIGDWATAAEAHTHAGGVLRDLNRPAEAVVEHRCALEMADRVQDPQRRAFTVGKSHLRIARAYMQVGRYAEASGAFAEAWSAAQLASDARLTEDVALFASQCYEEQGELDAAQEWGERLLAHVEGQQPMQEDVRADCLNRLALISLRAGRLDEAEERLRRAEHAARASGDEPTQANVSGNLGIIASQRDQHERALALQAECLRLNWHLANGMGVAQALGNGARAEEALGRTEAARAYRHAAVRWYWRAGALHRVAGTLLGMAAASPAVGGGGDAICLLLFVFAIHAWRKQQGELRAAAPLLAAHLMAAGRVADGRKVWELVAAAAGGEEAAAATRLEAVVSVCEHGDPHLAAAELATWAEAPLSPLQRALVLEARSHLAHRRGDPEDELAALGEAAELLQTACDRPRRLAVLERLAALHGQIGDSARALGVSETIWAEAPATGSKAGAAAAHELGLAQNRAGQYRRALEFHEAGLRCLMGLPVYPGREIAAARNEIGVNLLALGRLGEAEDVLRSSIRLSCELGLEGSEATSRSNLANALLLQAEHGPVGQMPKDEREACLAEAEREARQAKDLAASVGDALSEGICLGCLANVLLAQGRPLQALEHATAGIAVHRQIGHSYGVASKLTLLGRVLSVAGELDRSMQAYEQSVRMYVDLGSRAELIHPYHEMASILARQGQTGRAIEFLEEAMDCDVEDPGVPGTGEAPSLRTRRVSGIVADLVGLRLARGDPLDQVHRAIDWGRARYSTRELAARAARPSADVPVKLLAREAELRRRLREAQGSLRRAASFEESRATVDDRDAAASDLGEVMKAINGYDPAYARARSGETSDLGALQEALDRAFADCLHGCAVLEYYALDEELLVWLLAPQRAPELTRMPIRQAELWGLAERWREALGHPPDDRRGACAEDARLGDGQLRDRLLPEDVRTRLRELPHVTHLCIVPNDILADVPFAALGPPGGQLSERYSLSVADSAAGVSALLAAWEGPRPPPPEASVMGVVRDDPGEAGLQQWVLDGTRAVAAVCGCDAETGAGVTARRLLEALADRGIVHLTCHGEVDDYDPMESGILLSDRPPTDGEPVAVGVRPHRLERLTARHIADAEIAADLVFVNACESGRTTRDLSEEPLGLTRALIWAGAKSAIGTLWPVHGKAASYLAETFYRELRKGHYSKAEALAAAQRSIAASPHWADPYYWASYVLVGQWA